MLFLLCFSEAVGFLFLILGLILMLVLMLMLMLLLVSRDFMVLAKWELNFIGDDSILYVSHELFVIKNFNHLTFNLKYFFLYFADLHIPIIVFINFFAVLPNSNSI